MNEKQLNLNSLEEDKLIRKALSEMKIPTNREKFKHSFLLAAERKFTQDKKQISLVF